MKERKLLEQKTKELDEVGRIIHYLFTVGKPARCTTRIAKAILLRGPITTGNRTITPRAKNLGAGVYEIFLPNNEKR